MGDNMKKVRTGDSLDIPAATFNTFIDSARDFLQRQSEQRRTGAKDVHSSGIILIKNASGEDRERFQILGLGDPVISPDDNEECFKNRIALTGEMPSTTTHAGKFTILLEPLKSGSIGRGLVTGVTPVKLSVGSESDTCADLADADATCLHTSSTGPAQILWKESGTGMVWGIVRIPYATGGGSAEIELVQVTAVDTSAHTVSVKPVILKSDLTATPNFTVSDTATVSTYPYLVSE